MALAGASCGGKAKPAAGPTAAKNAEASEPAKTTAATVEAKKASKYPAPFLEPDCGEPKGDGRLPNAKQIVGDVRRANWTKLLACASDAGEDVHGEVSTSFRLDADGVPRCVEAPGSSLANQDVLWCVLSVYRTFRFTPPNGGSLRVTDTIRFEGSQDADDEKK